MEIYYFYSDYCGHCNHFKPEWNKFKSIVNKNQQIKIKEIKDCDDKFLCTKYNINGFPTILLLYDSIQDKYAGRRDAVNLYSYISSKI